MQKTSTSKALLIRETTTIRLNKNDIVSHLRMKGLVPTHAQNIEMTNTDDAEIIITYVTETIQV